MAAPHEKSARASADAAADPVYRPTAATPREERRAAGYEAYGQAGERHRTHGLDEATAGLYRKAAHNLLMADVWLRPSDEPRNPAVMLTRAACLGWMAEATPYGVFYDDAAGRGVEVKPNLQRLARDELATANSMMLGENPAAQALSGEMTTGIVVDAAVSAAVESGTGEHVVVHGIGELDAGTPDRLRAGGEIGMERFMGAHALQTEHGGRFTAIMAEREATAIHDLPVMPGGA